jgi:hypothetical protein
MAQRVKTACGDGRRFELFPQAEPGDDVVIAFRVFFADVLEQRRPCGDHFEQAASAKQSVRQANRYRPGGVRSCEQYLSFSFLPAFFK